MNMAQAIRSVFRNYATFTGRARSAEYWWYALADMIFIFALTFGTIALAAALYPNGGNGAGTLVILGYALLGLYVLASLVPRIAVTVRRIQDAGLNGSLFWLSFVPAVGSTIILILTLLPGTRGPNRYGPDPRDEDSFRDVSRAGAWSQGPIPQNAFATTRITPRDYVPPPMQGPGAYSSPQQTYGSQFAPQPYVQQPAQPYVQQPAPPYVQQSPAPVAPAYVQPPSYPQPVTAPPAPPFVPQPPAPPYVQHPPAPPYVQHPPAPPYVQQPPAPPYVQQPPAPPYVQQPPAPPYVQQPPPPNSQQPPPPPAY